MEKVQTSCIGINETVNSYWGRTSDILLRMGYHYIHDSLLRNTFVGWLYHFELMIYVREHTPTTREKGVMIMCLHLQ